MGDYPCLGHFRDRAADAVHNRPRMSRRAAVGVIAARGSATEVELSGLYDIRERTLTIGLPELRGGLLRAIVALSSNLTHFSEDFLGGNF